MGKPELQRIESTLDQLNPSSSHLSGRSPSVSNQGCSFKIWSTPLPHHRAQLSGDVQPFPVQTSSQMPTLPKFKLPEFSSHRHVANPALAMNVLKDIEAIVTGWQTELQTVLLQIQELYLEGPIIDGWLESDAPATPNAESTTLRHAEVDHLMDYVQDICNIHPSVAVESPRTGYRLCGLDADGKLWSRPCPPEQLPHVSLAVARYQKLRQLLGRKQDLEARLSQLASSLGAVQERLVALP
jgi:hypothetical protein